ncbi:protein-disulfide reductase DsbD family protein [Paenalcaligenes niemegkensis]|uniref:protein-disulfide reductase DsbD domain-containing protein n=1 Tax=Paenalcaligenes niemegkensis TaxID=2895469 RepID=UPI001EE9A8E1|nr:protein-disulfide reductase DsbD domain-containing protein [Paenalcaligenes niemegkensis]MCQ9617771.1 protein-disulfide reductase DsbD family protein [Paenalcaligenes niemegkensis]
MQSAVPKQSEFSLSFYRSILALTHFARFRVGLVLLQRQFKTICLLMLVLLMLLMTTPLHAADDYLDPEDAFQLSVAMSSDTELDVHFVIAPDYYMYRDRFEFEAQPSSDWLGEAQYPPAKFVYDPTFDETMATYRRELTVRIPLIPGSPLPLRVAITSQGCADAGLCYSPIVNEVTLTPTDTGYKASGQWVKETVPAPLTEVVESHTKTSAPGLLSVSDTGLADYLGDAGFLRIVGLSFLLGLMLSFTPCVLPMVPILLGIIAGQSKEASVSRGRGSPWLRYMCWAYPLFIRFLAWPPGCSVPAWPSGCKTHGS